VWIDIGLELGQLTPLLTIDELTNKSADDKLWADKAGVEGGRRFKAKAGERTEDEQEAFDAAEHRMIQKMIEDANKN